MLDFQQLKAQEHHSQLEIDEKKRGHGLLVSQPFPHPLYVSLPLRLPTSRTMCDMQHRWLDLLRITLEKHREADLCPE